jgi:hypothetical protein
MIFPQKPISEYPPLNVKRGILRNSVFLRQKIRAYLVPTNDFQSFSGIVLPKIMCFQSKLREKSVINFSASDAGFPGGN